LGKTLGWINSRRRGSVSVARQQLVAHGLGAFRWQPILVQNLLHQALVQMWTYEFSEGKCDVLIFALAVSSSLLRKVVLLHDIGKGRGIGTVGDAKQIVESLGGHAVHI